MWDDSVAISDERWEKHLTICEFSEEKNPVAYRSSCLRIGTFIVLQKIIAEYDFGSAAGSINR